VHKMPEICPECGCDLSAKDPAKHALAHWPLPLTETNSSILARQRFAALMKMAAERGSA